MTNAPPQPEQQPADQPADQPYIITLEGEDGSSHQCQIIDIITLDGNEYGILLKLNDEGKEDDEESLVIMKLLSRDDQSIFRTIESDEEFERVLKYVEKLAREAAEAVEAEE